MENKISQKTNEAGKIILPIDYPKIMGNIIFLAGPIIAAPKWQNNAIKIIQRLNPRANIACPTYNIDEKYFKDHWNNIEDLPIDYDNCWPELDWQMHYIDEAFNKGCLMFWLAKEEKHNCNYSYAQGTRIELFSHLYKQGNIALGIDYNFGNTYYQREFSEYYFKKKRPEIPIYRTLEETCKAAVEIANKNKEKQNER
ncbi:MAG: hypothetical protein ACP5OG_00845 [Candidatus Nanoarchaeia archaeon]